MVNVDSYTSFRFNNIGTTSYLERTKVGLCVRHVKYKYSLACRGKIPNSAHSVLVVPFSGLKRGFRTSKYFQPKNFHSGSLSDTFYGSEPKQIRQETFENQLTLNIVSKLVSVRCEKTFKPLWVPKLDLGTNQGFISKFPTNNPFFISYLLSPISK